jgi:flagellar biosynthesis protein FliQ
VSAEQLAAATRDMLMLTLLLLTPFLATAVLVSFIVGVLQASTRINDLTLSFVPRFAAALVVLYVVAGWAVAHLGTYIERSFIAAAQIVGG